MFNFFSNMFIKMFREAFQPLSKGFKGRYKNIFEAYKNIFEVKNDVIKTFLRWIKMYSCFYNN